MLIHSMSVSVDGFIADREGGFGWTNPNATPGSRVIYEPYGRAREESD